MGDGAGAGGVIVGVVVGVGGEVSEAVWVGLKDTGVNFGAVVVPAPGVLK